MGYKAFSLRGDGDRAEVQRLWRDNLGDQRIKSAIAARWQWMTESNPAGPAKICVVTDADTGQAVGSAGALPRMLRIGGKLVRGGVLCDFVVDKNHRVAGAAVSLQRALVQACFADGFDLLYGFPNEAAFPIFARVGYKTVGTSTTVFRPLRSSQKLSDYVPPVVARTAGFFVDRVVQAYDLQLYLRHRRGLGDSLCERAGGAFQALWEEAKPASEIEGERTPAHLNWRYATHPIEKCAFFCLTDRSERLLGYIAYTAVLGKVNVLDAFWDGRDALLHLFARFVWRMRAEDHASVTVVHAGASSVVAALRRLAFIQGKQQRKLICAVAKPQQESLGPTAFDASHWSLFDGELDI